ncbi:hypothetical protein [Sedimentibacter sp. MB31-C6]|uniref:hypothetical protein n=1 Tax=Sedimentibacter sp. MB31-C6 TaxID=3109366 RepID=UPI002DDCECDB|nr:hypothetical protein [Sedimentibacter sp. MB36-C1]WSI05119.1 hypothetical protein U8307_04820 [Sedimentibacter sp. MB36-C1]
MDYEDNNLYNEFDENIKEDPTNFIGIYNKDDGNSIFIKTFDEHSIEITKEMSSTFEQLSELDVNIKKVISDLIKDDKKIERFMTFVNVKGVQELYIDDAAHKGVTEGPVNYLSRREQIEKIIETIVQFKNPVIVYSKEELERLQAEYKKASGKTEPLEKSNMVNNKKSELLKLMDEQSTRGYIRISNEDYLNIKKQIEELDIPFISKESGVKFGMNITVPIDKIKELKNLILVNDIKILQEVEGNIDWNKIKQIKGVKGFNNVREETLKEFQNDNCDKFKYIAFEKDGKYSVYVEPSCPLIIQGDIIKQKAKFEKLNKKTMKDVSIAKDEYKKSKQASENKSKEKNNDKGER